MENNRELIVIKFGSESLVNDLGIDTKRIADHAQRVAEVYSDHDVLVVTSGAVAWGRHRLERAGKATETYSKRTLAMLGSAGIAAAWESAFDETGLTSGQVLASHHEIRDNSFEAENFKMAYETARRDFAIPILNHNDFMAQPHSPDDELDNIAKGKDNDEFSYEVARLLGADALMLATNVEGFTKDGVVLKHISREQIPMLKQYLYNASSKGTGGMGPKLEIAARARTDGMRAIICHAGANFVQVLNGAVISTEVVLK